MFIKTYHMSRRKLYLTKRSYSLINSQLFKIEILYLLGGLYMPLSYIYVVP